MKILGIDPGLRVTGYGLIDDQTDPATLMEAGVIETVSSDDITVKLERIFDGISEILSEFNPEVLILEKIYSHYDHPTTSILMAHARGVICLAAQRKSVPLVSLPSTRVKKSIISNGHATKQQVQEAVRHFLRLKKPPAPFDVSDALALAISHSLTRCQKAVESV
jgi:crossover junction endodeoxyribonuclease RuvC